MSDKEFHARKMVAREFISEKCYSKTVEGRRCHFAVEGSTGATITGLTWDQAVALAEKFNLQHSRAPVLS